MKENVQVILVGKNDLAFSRMDKTEFDVPVVLTDSCKKTDFWVLNILKKIHLSGKTNRIINLPFKQIWAADLSVFVTDKNIEYYFIFTNATLSPLPPDKLNELKRWGNVHYIMLFGDTFDSIYSKCARYYYEKVKFDYIFTIDFMDASEKGFIYTYFPYNFKINKSTDGKSSLKNDIYFAGAAKDRLDFLLKIYEKLLSGAVNANFRITGVDKKNQRYNDKIIYNKPVSYKTILETVYESNCILEVLAYKQTGSTLRYYEAVVNNKKLLTNNKNVVNLPFYNPDYIHVFETGDDIDTKWVIERSNVDYHYDGRFSMSHFVDRIIAMESEKET